MSSCKKETTAQFIERIKREHAAVMKKKEESIAALFKAEKEYNALKDKWWPW